MGRGREGKGVLTCGAPKACRVWRTRLTGSLLRPTLVVSFPSLQVPAPPSPAGTHPLSHSHTLCDNHTTTLILTHTLGDHEKDNFLLMKS